MFNLIEFLLKDNSIWFNICVSLLVIYFIYYVKNIVSYPRGPFPLPVLGNVLAFRGKVKDASIITKMSKWSNKYGPIYTIWVGNKPIIMVNSFELNCDASIVKKNDFINRTDSIIHGIFKSGTQNVFSTNGPHWEALRKVAFFAIRKFALGDRLPQIVCEVMDEAVNLMAKEKQLNPILYIDFMIYNILALTAYGEKFGPMDDKLFREAKRLNDEFYEVAGNGLIADFIPWLRPFYYKNELALKDSTKASVEIAKAKYLEHKKSFTPGVIRDFIDCVLEAKEEAIRENFDRNKYLNDDNLYMVVNDLFIAGTDTTQTTMRWALLMLANDQKLQKKIFAEINENIGERMTTQDDKNVLPLTYTFLLETLRFRPSAPMGMDHKTTVKTELGGHKIPKNTTVLFNLYEQNNDPKYWTNPEKFDPNRFLDSNGKLKSGRFSSFVPFGLGRRGCPGEKLALNNAFFMITRLMQKIKLELTTGAGTANVEPLNFWTGCQPKDYELFCSLR